MTDNNDVTNLEQQILNQAKSAIGTAIKSELTGYNSPLSKLVERVMAARSDDFYKLINDAFTEALKDDEFVAEFKCAVRTKTAKVLVSKVGGEIEKRVNELRANPATRAKIVVAIEKLVDEINAG